MVSFGECVNFPVRRIVIKLVMMVNNPFFRAEYVAHCKSINNWWYNRVTLDGTPGLGIF